MAGEDSIGNRGEGQKSSVGNLGGGARDSVYKVTAPQFGRSGRRPVGKGQHTGFDFFSGKGRHFGERTDRKSGMGGSGMFVAESAEGFGREWGESQRRQGFRGIPISALLDESSCSPDVLGGVATS